MVINGTLNTEFGQNMPPYYFIRIREITVTSISKDPETGYTRIGVTSKGNKIKVDESKNTGPNGKTFTQYNIEGFSAELVVNPNTQVRSAYEMDLRKSLSKGEEVNNFVHVGDILFEADMYVAETKYALQHNSREDLARNASELRQLAGDDKQDSPPRTSDKYTFYPGSIIVMSPAS